MSLSVARPSIPNMLTDRDGWSGCWTGSMLSVDGLIASSFDPLTTPQRLPVPGRNDHRLAEHCDTAELSWLTSITDHPEPIRYHPSEARAH